MKKVLLASLAGLGMMASLAVASPAMADPADPATLNGSGSDTTEIVMGELDAVIPALGSWNVSGSVPWDTNGAAPGCSINVRILGSGDGRRALSNSVTNADGCFQYARTSARAVAQATATVGGNYTAPAATVDQVPIALATDGLTYVFRASSSTPRNLTLGQLRAIYSCTFTGVVDGLAMASPTVPNQPLLPTDASGSRADWVALMGLAAGGDVPSDGGAYGACLNDGPGDTGIPGGEYAEHNGNVLNNGRQIILHSIAQYIGQGRSLGSDTRGLAVLGYINGNVPLQQYDNPAGALVPATASGSAISDGAYFRTVYNNVPAGRADDADVIAVFGERAGGNDVTLSDIPVANSGTGVCDLDDIVIRNGFTPVC